MHSAMSYAFRNRRLLGSAFFTLLLLAGFFMVARNLPAKEVVILVGAIGLSHLYFDAVRQRRSQPDAAGWRKLSVGPMERFALIGSAIATAFFVLIYFGSSHPDTVKQAPVLLLLMTGFGLGTVIAFLSCYIKRTRWDDHVISQTSLTGVERVFPWPDVISMTQEAISQYELIRTIDGRKLRFSPYANGADVLRTEAAVWAAMSDLLFAVRLTSSQLWETRTLEEFIREKIAQDGRFALFRHDGALVLEGPSAEHVTLFVQRLHAAFAGTINAGPVHILRRATIAGSVGRVGEQHDAVGAAMVELIVGPCDPSDGNVITHELAAPLDDATEAVLLKGVNEVLAHGVDGIPVLGVAITVTRVSYAPGADDALAGAVREALLLALTDAMLVPLEPWMKSHIDVPDDAVKAVMADWRARGGTIAVFKRDKVRRRAVLTADAPLSNLEHYRADLRRLTNNRADAFLLFDRMERASTGVQPN